MMFWIIALPALTFLLAEKTLHAQVPAVGNEPTLPFGSGAWIVSFGRSLSFASRKAKIEAGLITKQDWRDWYEALFLLSSQAGESGGISLSFHQVCTRVRAEIVPGLFSVGLPSLSTSVPPSAKIRVWIFPWQSGVRPRVMPNPKSCGGAFTFRMIASISSMVVGAARLP